MNNDDERDYAEEKYNRELLRNPDGEPSRAVLPGDPVVPEPISGTHRSALLDELDTAIEALEGDSNDAEHDALYGLASVVARALGADFDPRAPDSFDDEDALTDATASGRIESSACDQ